MEMNSISTNMLEKGFQGKKVNKANEPDAISQIKMTKREFFRSLLVKARQFFNYKNRMTLLVMILILLQLSLILIVSYTQNKEHGTKKGSSYFELKNDELVELNIGGQIFITLRSTLTKRVKKPNRTEYYNPNLLEIFVKKQDNDKKKAIFIDRSPKHFNYVLDFLRKVNTNAQIRMPTDDKDLMELKDEAIYYKIEGLIELTAPFLNSSIITLNQNKDLFKLCNFPFNSKWKLLYRGTVDGFSSEDFHNRCDNISRTLTIIKSANSNIFGGYTGLTWDSTTSHKSDSNTFLFSLVNIDKAPIRMNYNRKGDCIYCSPLYGPSFGEGSDLRVSTDSNVNQNSYANLGYSYTHPKYGYGSIEARSFMAGAYYFQVIDIEVFVRED